MENERIFHNRNFNFPYFCKVLLLKTGLYFFHINRSQCNNTSYQIKLPQFEGPFDLLLFFIERDELDIYNIPSPVSLTIFLITFIKSEELNIELSSEFILFISTLMRIKAKMLLPRKELDAQGNEIDPRQELINKILEYKRFKEASAEMAEMEALRMLMVKRGNIQKELSQIGEEDSEGTEIQNITLFKLMRAFEKAMQKYSDRTEQTGAYRGAVQLHDGGQPGPDADTGKGTE